jgi:hypothetical protein
VPQFVTYNWVSFFFSGFVVAKVPFALTMRFRQMLQRGVDLQGLDVTYISSLSWYLHTAPRPPPRDTPVAQASSSAQRRLRTAPRDTASRVPRLGNPSDSVTATAAFGGDGESPNGVRRSTTHSYIRWGGTQVHFEYDRAARAFHTGAG